MFTHVVFQGPEKFWYIFLLGGVIMFVHVVFQGPEKFWYVFLLGVIMFFHVGLHLLVRKYTRTSLDPETQHEKT
jgi:lipid-A-disaccharide synthase-like uncharacterized protein